MNNSHSGRAAGALTAALALALSAPVPTAAAPATGPALGPFNVDFPAGGADIVRPMRKKGEAAPAPIGASWSILGWVQPSEVGAGRVLVGGVGDPDGAGRYLALQGGRVSATTAAGVVTSQTALSAGQWRFVAAVSDGSRLRLYVDGVEVANGAAPQGEVAPILHLGPRHVAGTEPFAGKIAGFSATGRALSPAEIAAAFAARPNPALVVFDTAAPTWPVQIHGMAGLTAPQDPWTLPQSGAAPSAPRAVPAYDGPALKADGPEAWTLARWSLAEAPKIDVGGAVLSAPGYNAKAWYAATVPGTVLTTLVDRGVYPDPEYGLNNMAIPESLARQAYWYRTEFTAPASLAGRRAALTFNGINYAAEIWLNGQRLGDIKGAFTRGRFDVSALVRPGQVNALAVRVSPPPHPGIPHEQSLSAGAGENGGMQALDGPTFFATEGWDWIPGVRDRNTGLWQDVTLTATGPERLGDVQVVTTLPKTDNSEADVEISVPVENLTDHAIQSEVTARFDEVAVTKTVSVPVGGAVVKLTPAEFPQLAVHHPRLWWPNGYGEAALHGLHVTLRAEGAESDRKDLRFGMREITYELSLMDQSGHLRRAELDFAKARALGQTLTDQRHEAIRKSADGWVGSFAPGAETSPAVRTLPPSSLSPYLVIKVNGVRIAARGGSWGMDDWRKRVSRERLEPYFRLHREAHLNIIRNWMGQDTEETFFDLADEYGLLILNDFWDSTQDFQMEPQDVPLFLANAADVIRRYRNHPSIAVWFGRNEGVPQPILNEGLERLIHDLDGTRYYSASSNRVNLQDSGPYNYREPQSYFTEHAKGFAVEVGTPSFPTLEAFEANVAPADRWPISDAWAYHDWHQDGNGATGSFMNAMTAKLGAPTSLEDFERKAQLMNYETHRAMFEGLNAELWTRSSGRMLWMTQPAWPSTMWQILSKDYDTHAAFYGVKAAAEPVHVQMNLPEHRVDLVNNTQSPIKGAQVTAKILGLDGRALGQQGFSLDAGADDVGRGPDLDLARPLADNGAVVVALEARASDGRVLSHNLYWLAADAAASRKLDQMAPQPVSISAVLAGEGAERRVEVTLRNTGGAPALNNKLTLTDAAGARILPAYYSDNYVSLLPGERRTVTIAYPAAAGGSGAPRVALRGWNTQPMTTIAAP